MTTDPENNNEENHGRVADFFHHHAVTFFFGCMFLSMMVFGLVMSGAVDVPAGAEAGYSQVPLNALFILLAFGGAMAFTFLWPRWMGLYLIVVLVMAFVFQSTFEFSTEAVNAQTQAPGNHSPAPFLFIVYLLFAVYGTFFMFSGPLKEALFGSSDGEESE